MNLGKTLYVTDRKAWRLWLEKHYDSEKEIWLVYYKKNSMKPRIPYNDAVEEALCFGWIDSTMKKIDEERSAQRFTPRRKNSSWSEMNKERARRLIKSGLMTETGLKKINDNLNEKFVISEDILKEIKKNKIAWKNFQKFPKYYQRIRIAYIDSARELPSEFHKRLNYFIKMTAKNKKIGMIQ
ncbi:MAG: YdeI/OmpD-associated family protein [Candidatus Diapherotrites archaeon]|nr:YdeI/OmpD-associated family protein [Candidatus Diapherotrites archaeon]